VIRILTISSHPDDEVLAVGGTLAQASRCGCMVRSVVVTDGCEGYTLQSRSRIAETRRSEVLSAHSILGVGETSFLERQELTLHRDKVLLKEIVRAIRDARPNVVLTHNRADQHVDHKDTHDLVYRACLVSSLPAWPDLGQSWRAERMYTFEVIRGALELPTHYVDITEYLAVKMQAVEAFESQVQANTGLVAMVEAIGAYRGAQIGCRFAEALTQEFPVPSMGFHDLIPPLDRPG
jgi:LmbE family N-acetylglucosaminyl deacetylase